jgi:hypothetical protein
MQTFVTKYYVEPENIATEIVQDEDEVIFNVTRTSYEVKTGQMCICVNKSPDLHY